MKISVCNIKIRFITNVVLPIIVGVIIYICFRNLYFFDQSPKYFLFYINHKIPNWFIYNLPDGLWLYSFLNVISFIWRDKPSKNYLLWLFVVIISSLMTELFQKLEIISGTFDINDIATYMITFTLFCVFNKKQIHNSLTQI